MPNFSKITVTIVVLIAVSSVCFAAGAAAQNATETESNNSNEYQQIIDEDTRIVSSSWDRGQVTILVESDKLQTLTITDGSIDLQAQKSGVVPRKFPRVTEGRTEVTFTVSNPGDAAVTVAASRKMIFLSPGRGGSAIIGGPWSANDVRASAVGSVISVSIVTMFFVFRRIRSPSKEGDRIA